MADLTIPDAARAAFADQHNLPAPTDGFRGAVDWAAVDADIRAVAAPVVAAELRRIADGLAEGGTWTQWGTVDAVVSGLRKRADELDPDGGAS